jgi:hypothetical protein
LERAGSEWKSNARGEFGPMPVYRIDRVTLGSLTFRDVRAVGESSTFPEFMPGDGVLGRGLLEGLTLDIDLPGGRLGVLPAGMKPPDFDASQWQAVPLLAMDDGPVVSMRIDDSDRALAVVLDTGAIANGPEGAYGVVELPGDLDADDELVEGLPMYRAQDVRLGEVSIGPMRFLVMDHADPPGTDGFLGNALYAARRVLVVPSEEKVFLQR